ncbi:MAG: tetratricopeptide repeat protein [Planctomycetota bacterium]
MTPHQPRRSPVRLGLFAAVAALAAACGEGQAHEVPVSKLLGTPALRIALVEHLGEGALDEQIRATQSKVQEQPDVPRLERLATLFISKARVTGDPGFYKQAEACANAMPVADGGDLAARLVRGHVKHALHDFAAAESIARGLVQERGLFLDHGLLGDVLLDQGRIDEARTVYQKMVDLKPCLQSYARAAQLRWMQGDAGGCRELLGNAAASGSRRDPESLAWVMTRLASLDLQCSDFAAALRAADEALELVPSYPAALMARGRAAAGLGQSDVALASFAAAAERYPLPEHLWAFSDALRAAGSVVDAARVEAQLERTGETEDPRTLALWLATMQRDVGRSLRLAEAESKVRQDAFTLDALAFARFRAGDVEGARAAMQQALAVGVRDARLLLHAALVADAAGERDAAIAHVAAARERKGALLPSERGLLADLTARL